MRLVEKFAALALCLALTGCGVHTFLPASQQASALRGSVHGGQQPIVGAHVYVFAANTTGYAGPGIAASSANASTSLLRSASTGLSDSLGAYVLTSSDGSFSVSADYTCTTGTAVYLLALGGNAGAGTNSASALLALLGACPAAGTLAGTVPSVWINEVSTVAAAYAMAGFATNATHVSSSGTTLARTGILNAFANAPNLADTASGVALSTTPAGNGVVPQAKINTLANILAACVNSSDAAPGACTTLFANTRADGATGALPADTATAAIHIAHNPAANVGDLYSTTPPQVAFAPALTAQPNDFTLAITVTGGGISGPQALAVDALGNVWVASYNNILSEFAPASAPLSTTGFTGNGLADPLALAIDSAGNIWLPNASDVTASAFYGASATLPNVTGAPLPGSPFSGGGLSHAYGLAFDAAGNLWLGNSQASSGVYTVSELSPTGVALFATGYTGGGLNGSYAVAVDPLGYIWVSGFPYILSQLAGSTVPGTAPGTPISPSSGDTGGGMKYPEAIAIDANGVLWMANLGNDSLSAFYGSNSAQQGTAVSSSGYTGGGLSTPAGIAIDGAGKIWVTNRNSSSLSLFDASGTPIAPAPGYTADGLYHPNGIAIDGSGNIWVTSHENAALVEFIGVASPVVTPIVANLLPPYAAHAVNRP